jgi:hypothetical protein
VRPPVDADALERAEVALSRRLPSTLRQAFLTIGDGGFGPGYGLLPLFPVSGADVGESIVELYRGLSSRAPEDPAWIWPAHLVVFCDWGCAIRSCVDCSSENGAVVTFDPSRHEIGGPMSLMFAQTHSSIEAWFKDWLDDVKIWDLMFEPDPNGAKVGVNPFTREPMKFAATRLRRLR